MVYGLCIVLMMLESSVSEFPFVQSLPKREKSKLARLWDHFHEVRAAAAQHGVLLPQHYVADLLSLSKQRVGQFVDEGRLDSIEVGGLRYVTEKSLLAFVAIERRNGRPPKIPTLGTVFGKALDSAAEIAAKKS